MKSILYNLMIMYFAFSYVLNANAQTDLKQIESLFNEGKYEEVVMKSKSINPQTGKLHFLVSQSHYKLGDYISAKESLKKSASAGYSQALYLLGRWYRDGGIGDYTDKADTIKALEVFQRLFYKEDSLMEESLHQICGIYEEQGDLSKAKSYVSKSVNKNVGYAYFVQAVSYENGLMGYEPDEDIAANNYVNAITYSKMEWVKGASCTNLGILKCKKQSLGWMWKGRTATWQDREIQPQNAEEQDAAKLWKEAIGYGEKRRAPYLLAIHQYETVKNYSKAISLFRMSADNGYAPAQCKMGEYFEKGIFVAQDFQEAIKWYTLAVNNGDGEAEISLGLCYEQLYRKNNDERMLKSALKYYYRADKHGYARSIIDKIDEEGRKCMRFVHPALPLYEEGVLDSKEYKTFEDWNNKVLATLAIDSDVDVDIPLLGNSDKSLFALIIANENYLYEEYVPYGENDGTSVAKYLQWCIGVPEQNIHIVKDATLNKMRWELDWINEIKNSGLAKRIYFYYAGHGIPADNQQTSFLLPVDGYAKNVSTGLDINDIVKKIQSDTTETYCFIDACFSGGKRRGGMLIQSRGVAVKAKETDLMGKTVMMMACQNDETAYAYNDKKHGLFTYYLLKELKRTKGNVSIGNLYESIKKNVTKTSIEVNNKIQTPNLSVSKTFENWQLHKIKE